MSEVPTKVVVNCATGVTETLPLTEEEIAQREADAIAAAAAEAERIAAEEAKAAARQSAIDKFIAMGLTEEEALAIVDK
jgi:hypothetical protein